MGLLSGGTLRVVVTMVARCVPMAAAGENATGRGARGAGGWLVTLDVLEQQAVSIAIAGDQGVLTPTLTGAQPALFTSKGKVVRPLGAESDKALALLKTLNVGQKKKAVLSYQLADLVLGPGQDGKTIVPEGLK